MAELVSLVKGEWPRLGGGIGTFSWKAVNMDHTEVLWELTSPLHDLHSGVYSKSTFEVHHFLRRNRDILSANLAQLGEEYAFHFVPSRLAKLRRRRLQQDVADEAAGPVASRAEWSSSSLGLLVLLLWFIMGRRVAKERKAAHKLALAFLTKALPEAWNIRDRLEELLQDFVGVCQAQPMTNGRCCHVSSLVEAFSECAGAVSQEAALLILVCIQSKVVSQCPCIQRLHMELVGELAELIDLAILGGRFQVSGAELAPNPSDRKRSRTDEHFKDFIIREAVTLKMAKTGRSMLRAGAKVDPSLATKWEAEAMLHYMAASLRVMRGSAQVGVAEDAARLGDPPEETLLLLVWSQTSDTTTIAPPQV